MGVPALFRWLSRKYPKIITSVIEEKSLEVDGDTIPVNVGKPNPNGEEFDNLYLDMNGIVHPCSHPEDRPPPATESEMMMEVFKYTDRIMNMVRPRKLLMIAVDGVAPRAKMNQQRSRRFRSAQEAKDKDEEKAEFVRLLKAQNGGALTEAQEEELNKKSWDSNAITPGTPFMFKLGESLRYWAAHKLQEDPAWKDLKIIISDATVPGEGEHKIMNFIRSQRQSPQHDPNTRHVLYGLDADLIMLGLGTHEPHFRILREDVFFQDSKPRTCNICKQPGHIAENCTGEAKFMQGKFDEKSKTPEIKPFIWLHVAILREYLAEEMSVAGYPMDLERIIDDWVFMCFFVGNDFLPHLPSLDVREQGIDTLTSIWKQTATLNLGYVTKDGYVQMERLQKILRGLSSQESAIFKKRRETEESFERKAKKRKLDAERRASEANRRSQKKVGAPNYEDIATVPLSQIGSAVNDNKYAAGPRTNLTYDMIVSGSAGSNKSAAAVLKEQMAGKSQNSGQTPAPQSAETPFSNSQKRSASQMEESQESQNADSQQGEISTSGAAAAGDDGPVDTVRLWEEGYEDRYYQQKFGKGPEDLAFRRQVAKDYAKGLCWVLLYYFQGCPSWTWYYPHHYAPFAADFHDIWDDLNVDFDLGTPAKPYEQLMSVMPAASGHVLPEVFRPLMSEEDSPIIEFYPKTFDIDLNGKKMAWQGVALLPFIDSQRLVEAMATKYPLLTEEENARNTKGEEVLFFSEEHPMAFEVIQSFYSKGNSVSQVVLDEELSQGLAGLIIKDDDFTPGLTVYYPCEDGALPDVAVDQSLRAFYEMPKTVAAHKSMLLRGITLPKPVLDDSDRQGVKELGKSGGRFHGNGPPRNNHYNHSNRHGSGQNSANGYYSGPRPPPGQMFPGYPPGNYAPPYGNAGPPPPQFVPPDFAQWKGQVPFPPPPMPYGMPGGAPPMPPPPGLYNGNGYPPPPHGPPSQQQWPPYNQGNYQGGGGYRR